LLVESEKFNLLTPFYSPFLTELKRGNNRKKNYLHLPSLLKKRGVGGELEKEKDGDDLNKPQNGGIY
jgi:hypothetical protein